MAHQRIVDISRKSGDGGSGCKSIREREGGVRGDEREPEEERGGEVYVGRH